MALTETTINDRIEVVEKYYVQIRKANIIKKDGVELTRTFERKGLSPGLLDASDNLVDTDISGEDIDVQAICKAAWLSLIHI